MAFVFATWNVEHLGAGDPARLARAAAFIQQAHPSGRPIDVFGILEVKDAQVTDLMLDHFPTYDFHLTDGPQQQEILVGVRRGVFDQKIFVQKREFKAGNEFLRPGALISLKEPSGVWTNLLYLHTDSGTDASAFGNRFEMFGKIAKMKAQLDRKEVERTGDPAAAARLIVLGDLNTMGLAYPTDVVANRRIKAEQEIGELGRFAGLQRASKSHPHTWKGGAGKSDLDHVLFSAGLALVPLGAAFEVRVTGWVDLAGAAQREFLATMSDHSLLIGETA